MAAMVAMVAMVASPDTATGIRHARGDPRRCSSYPAKHGNRPRPAQENPMTDPIATLAGGLIVSCQAYPGEPLRHPETMAQMAEAVVAGGAAAIRAQGLADISFIKGRTTVPLIGLWKDGHDGVLITPTLRHARAVRDAGAEIVALDGTRRPRPDGLTLADTIADTIARLRDS